MLGFVSNFVLEIYFEFGASDFEFKSRGETIKIKSNDTSP